VNTDPDASQRRLRRKSWGLVGLLTVLGLFWGPSVAASVAAGGALAALNVEGLARTVDVLTLRTPKRASWLSVIGLGFRYLLLGMGLFVIVTVWRANVLALSLGLSAPVFAVFWELGLESMREFRSR
jgi:hypothetical protein